MFGMANTLDRSRHSLNTEEWQSNPTRACVWVLTPPTGMDIWKPQSLHYQAMDFPHLPEDPRAAVAWLSVPEAAGWQEQDAGLQELQANSLFTGTTRSFWVNNASSPRLLEKRP